ncbi:hypothetical protein H8S95_14740 [Pontibacter sp. KCTC 32443]|uniref:hypothetical protein n=1 Tax=Pontibacter TaxID=323449 RepID=UPI00164D4EB2|nr:MULTISPECIES: hypothetical protein [Pontibacter]MBC5775334.1 hypothetical protein [Pontibacter sp. KCTC 32443]
MKILVLLSASLFGFGLVCQDVTSVAKPATTSQVVIIPAEEPVATIALDTIEVVYEAPAAIAANIR